MTYDEFKAKYNIAHLNPQQEAAVQAIEGQTLVLAAPGSGKTTVLMTRLGYMVFALNIAPESILTISYTKASTKDMKERFCKIFGTNEQLMQRLSFRTINSLCNGIVNSYERHSGLQAATTIGEKERLKLLSNCYMACNKEYPTDQELRDLSTDISYVKNMLMTDEEINSKETEYQNFPAIFSNYNTALSSSGQMDFDDQLTIAYKILLKNPDILEYYKKKWPYINIDESQDTSLVQHKIVQLLVNPTSRASELVLFMVGDEDQSIYAFRAAQPACLYDFEKIYVHPHVLLMETNYRSTKNIVSIADGFIQNSKGRHPKHMIAAREEEGQPVQIHMLPSREAQYEYLAAVAQKATVQTACLFRENSSAIPLIDLLARKGIKYKAKEVDSFFFARPTVLDIKAILNFAAGGCTDRALFLKIYYKLGLFIKKNEVQSLLNMCPSGWNLLQALATYTGSDISPKVVSQAGKVLRAMTRIKSGNLSAVNALDEILYQGGYETVLEKRPAYYQDYYQLCVLAKNESSPESFLKRLDDLQEIVKAGSDDDSAKFILSTIHSSKGLEYPVVYIIDCTNRSLPSKSELDDPAQYAEDRRLFYVGMTRAENELHLFKYRNYESPFLSEIEWIKRKQDDAKKQGTGLRLFEKGPRPSDLKSGTVVDHIKFGQGVVSWNDGELVMIYFDSGQKTFDANMICSKGLIKICSKPII